MKLTIILLVILSLQSFAKVSAQQVTLSFNKTAVEKVISSIRKQTGYNFVIHSDVLRYTPAVTIHVTQVTLDQALHQLFTPIGLNFEIHEKSVVVKKAPEKPVDKPKQQETIRGRVTDSLGNPLQSVTITEVETGRKTITDRNGYFQFPNIGIGNTLSFKMIGYEAAEVIASGQEINLILKQLYSEISEVVVSKGYYNTTKTLNTGNSTTISGEVLARQPIGDPILALAGQVPGLLVRQNNGYPGRMNTIQLRGRNSIANGNDPLYIVDGVPFPSERLSSSQIGGITGGLSPFNTLNIDDIENITALKDADATAIYGSMGANGVIIISTKKGKEGATRLDGGFSSGWTQVAKRIELLDTEQYLELRREAYANANRAIPANQYDVNGTWDENRYTDWQDVFIGNTARMNTGNLRLSGGSRETQFTIGGNYRKEGTVFPGEYFDRKISLQTGLNHAAFNDKFRVNFSVNYTNNDNQLPETNFLQYVRLAPNAPALFDDEGNLNWENGTWDNPFADLNRRNRIVTDNYVINGSVGYEILPNLLASATFGLNQIKTHQDVLIPSASLAPAFQSDPDRRRHTLMDNKFNTWIAEPQLTYKHSLSGHDVDVLIGTTFRESKSNMLTQDYWGFSDDAMIENIHAAANRQTLAFRDIQYRYHAVFGRIGYAYKERYVANLTGRRDGSSRFGSGKQWGNFGAVGAAWVISNEPFFKAHGNTISFAKIRSSYGITGNDQLPDYQYLSTYSNLALAYLNNQSIIPSRLLNPDFGWESVKKLEAALELGFLEDRISLTTSWYRNTTGNQLVGYPLPAMSGFQSIQANLPAVIENKGWEFELTANVGAQDRLSYTVSANLSIPRNKLVSYPDFETSTYRQTYQVGKSLFGSYRFRHTGVDSETGLYTFEDVNGNGTYDLGGDRYFLETDTRLHGGMVHTLAWKGLSLSLTFQYMSGKRSMYWFDTSPGSAINANQPTWILDRWNQVGDSGTLGQKVSANSLSTNTAIGNSDFFIVDSRFLRLKNVNFVYSIPQQIIQQVKLKKVDVFFQGQNLLTFTNYKGIDPETASSSLSMPPVRMFNVGFNVSL